MESFNLKDYFNEIEKFFQYQLPKNPVKIYLKSKICNENLLILKALKSKIKSQTTEIIEKIMTLSQKIYDDIKEKAKKCKDFLKNNSTDSGSKLENDTNFNFQLYFLENLEIINSIIPPNKIVLNRRTKLTEFHSKSISMNSIKDLGLRVYHENQPTLLLFSENHQKLFYTHSLNHIEEFDYLSKNHSFKYIGHKDQITSMQLDSTETTLASGSFDCNIFLWDISSHTLKGKISYGCPFKNLQFTQDGSKLLSSSFERPLKVWDVKTLKNVETFTQSSDTISCFKLCSKGETLAIGANVIKLINFNTKVIQALCHRVTVQVNSIEFSKDSEKVFFTDKNSVKVWNLADDTCKIIESLPFEEKTLKKLIVDHENNLLAYCINNQITVKSLKNLNFIKEFNFYSQVIYHNQFINKKIIVWTGLHGFHFISLDNSINECFAGHPSMIKNARISGNQLIIITSANDFTIRLWNTVSKVEKIIPCLNTPPKALGISFDGCLVAALTEKILLWQVQKDILIQTKTNLNLPETILNISIINSSRLLLATDKFTFLSITLE